MVNRGLNINKEICSILAHLNGNSISIPKASLLELNKQPNFFSLLPPEFIGDIVNIENTMNSVYCQQGSEQSNLLLMKCYLTGSNMYTAIGLDSLKQKKSHFQDFVKCETSIVNTQKLYTFKKVIC